MNQAVTRRPQSGKLSRTRIPYRFPNNETVNFFLTKENDRVILTDGGETLKKLQSEFGFNDQSLQQQSIINFCTRYGIGLEQGVLFLPIDNASALSFYVDRFGQILYNLASVLEESE
ncbi:MAG: DUF1828 domain-containing protein [Acidobacteriota bacterium]